jgi:hypothetical protein
MKLPDSRRVGRSDRPHQRAYLLAAFALALQSVSPTVRLSAQMSPRDSALHALSRLAYGPRPGEVERVAREGVIAWIDRQLTPDEIDTHALAQRERRFQILRYDRTELARMFVELRRERRAAKRERGQAGDPPWAVIGTA